MEVERIPAEGRAIDNLEPTGDLVTGTPREGAFDKDMGQGGTDLVRAALVGCTARALGQPCDGSASGVRGLGRQPLPRPVAEHLRTSGGPRGALVSQSARRTETPTAGIMTESLYGTGRPSQA